jgi:hypothetical protein
MNRATGSKKFPIAAVIAKVEPPKITLLSKRHSKPTPAWMPPSSGG